MNQDQRKQSYLARKYCRQAFYLSMVVWLTIPVGMLLVILMVLFSRDQTYGVVFIFLIYLFIAFIIFLVCTLVGVGTLIAGLRGLGRDTPHLRERNMAIIAAFAFALFPVMVLALGVYLFA